MENPEACRLDSCHLGHWMTEACASAETFALQNSCPPAEAVI